MDDNTSPSSSPPHPELSYTTIPLNTPATEIRLLELFPSAEFSSPLHCRLYNTPISSPAPFKALSYAWGSDDRTHLIYIDSNNTSDNGNDADADANLASGLSVVHVSSGDNEVGDEVDTVDGGGAGAGAMNGEERADLGPNPDARMPGTTPTPTKRCLIRITSSLDTCLRNLRAIHHRDEPFTKLILWIDQLCIDQSNLDEKAAQVGLMNQIYSRAEQVLIWLGPAADGSDEVMDALAELEREFESVGVDVDDAERIDELVIGFLSSGGKGKGGKGGDGGNGGDVEEKMKGGEGVEEEMGKEKDAGKEMGKEIGKEMAKEMGGTGIRVGTGSTCGGDEVVDAPGDGDGDGGGVGFRVDLGVGVGVGAADEEKADAITEKTTIEIVADGAARIIRLWVSGELRAFFRRPWFTRVWVVQEACLCDDTVFVCGTKPPVSYDILGAIFLCMAHALQEFIGKGGFAPEWSGVSGTEIAGVRISRDMTRALGDLMDQTIASYTSRRYSLEQISEGKGAEDLSQLLVATYALCPLSREAKLHRDRVYALLGMAGDVDELEIKPDYSIQTGTARILTEVAKAIIGKTEDGFPVELLSYSQFPKTILDDNGSNEQLPSWVPDWRSGLQPPFYDSLNRAKEVNLKKYTGTDMNTFMACGTHRSLDMMPTTTAGMLGLRGYLVDTIEEVGGIMASQESSTRLPLHESIEFFEKLDRLWKLSKQKNKPIYKTSARREEALWRVPVGDMALEWRVIRYRAKADLALEYHNWRRTLEQYQALDIDLTVPDWAEGVDEDKKKKATEWAAHALRVYGGRPYDIAMELVWRARKSLYLTKKGYMGMGPSDIQPGDVVVVFSGARIPFVLRPASGEATFTYLGDAYCDGIMDGEITLSEEKREFFLV